MQKLCGPWNMVFVALVIVLVRVQLIYLKKIYPDIEMVEKMQLDSNQINYNKLLELQLMFKSFLKM